MPTPYAVLIALPLLVPSPLVRFEDVTGDGLPDMLSLADDGTLLVSVNLGGRRFSTDGTTCPVGSPSSVLVTDLDGDGRTDLYVIADGPNIALIGDGAGHFVDRTVELGLSDDGAGSQAEARDLDGDGLPDLLLRNRAGDHLFWNDGGAYRRQWQQSPAAAQGRSDLLPASSPSPTTVGPAVPQVTVTPSFTPSSSTPSMVSVAPGHPYSASVPLSFLDQRFVNDDAGEVDSADIADGQLTGADVSTSLGNVTFTGGSVGIGTSSPATDFHVAGDVQIDGALGFPSVTRVLSIPGTAFNGVDGTGFAPQGPSAIVPSSVTSAPVFLPQGAVIQGMTMTIGNSTPGGQTGFTMGLGVRPLGNGIPATIASMTYLGAGTYSVGGLSTTVNNDANIYYLNCWTSGSGSGKTPLHDVAITYTSAGTLP